MTLPVAAQTADDVLAFWHPVDDTEVDETWLPAGPVAPASSADQLVRLRNLSGDYTAAGITVTCEPGDDDVHDCSALMLLSVDGDTFARTATIGQLGPQQTSDVITVRRVVDPDTMRGDAAWLLTATAAAWQPAAYDPATAPDGTETPAEQPGAADTEGPTEPADTVGPADPADTMPGDDPGAVANEQAEELP